MNVEKNGFIKSLFMEYYDSLILIARRKLSIGLMFPSDLDDQVHSCVNAVFEAAHNDLETLMIHKNQAGWVYKTLDYRIKHMIRQRTIHGRRHIAMPVDEMDIEDDHDAIERLLERDYIRKLVALKDEREVNVFRLYFVEGRTLKDTAEQTNLRESTVRGIVDRIRTRAKNQSGDSFLLMVCILGMAMHYKG